MSRRIADRFAERGSPRNKGERRRDYRGSLRSKGERRRDSSRIAPYRRGAGAAFFVGQRLNDCSIDQSFKRERDEKNSRVAARAGESGERNFRVAMSAGESGKRALARRSRRGKEHSCDDGRGRERGKEHSRGAVGEEKSTRVTMGAGERGAEGLRQKDGSAYERRAKALSGAKSRIGERAGKPKYQAGRTGGGRYEKGFQTERT